MTTNKCVVHGKVKEANLVQRNSEYLGGGGINKRKLKKKKKKWNAQKDRILRYVKCQWKEIIHIEINR